MRVLSIDLDYIMGPSIEEYSDKFYHDVPSLRWVCLKDFFGVEESSLNIDVSNLEFISELFEKSLEECDSVSFGYEHDSILFSIEEFDNIDLINIDHHDDVLGGDYTKEISYEDALNQEFYELARFDIVHEGNWVAWLSKQNKLNSFTWIGNTTSQNKSRNEYNSNIIPNYTNIEKEDFILNDYTFDHIFVCMSPQYVPRTQWFRFTDFLRKYKEIKKKDPVIYLDKFETSIRHRFLNQQIMKDLNSSE